MMINQTVSSLAIAVTTLVIATSVAFPNTINTARIGCGTAFCERVMKKPKIRNDCSFNFCERVTRQSKIKINIPG